MFVRALAPRNSAKIGLAESLKLRLVNSIPITAITATGTPLPLTIPRRRGPGVPPVDSDYGQ